MQWILESLRAFAEVYNLGGGKSNSCSILEAFRMAEGVTGKKMNWRYVDENRIGDHICYYSDLLRKMKAHYPDWKLVKTLPMITSRRSRLVGGSACRRMPYEYPDYGRMRLRGERRWPNTCSNGWKGCPRGGN